MSNNIINTTLSETTIYTSIRSVTDLTNIIKKSISNINSSINFHNSVPTEQRDTYLIEILQNKLNLLTNHLNYLNTLPHNYYICMADSELNNLYY